MPWSSSATAIRCVYVGREGATSLYHNTLTQREIVPKSRPACVRSCSAYACAMICMHAALGCSCPTDTYRIQFLLSSYRRSRIQKIQSMYMFLLADKEAFEHMSKAEQDFCTGYANMVQRFLGASMFNVLMCSKMTHAKDRLNCTRARACACVRI